MTPLFRDKINKFYPRYVKDLGLSKAQCAGIFGNFAVETGQFKHLQELNPVVKGSKGGFGWAQWTGPRRKQYMTWCAKNNLKPEGDEANYRFSVHEFQTTEKAALEALLKCTEPGEAATTVMLKYERPGVPHAALRRKYAVEAYNLMNIAPEANTAIVAGTGAVVATAIAPEYWHIIIPAAFMFTVVTIILISYFKNRKAEKALTDAPISSN